MGLAQQLGCCLLGGVGLGPGAKSVFQFLQGACIAGTEKWIGFDQLDGQSLLVVQHLQRFRSGDAVLDDHLVHGMEMIEIRLRITMGKDAFDRVVNGSDIRKPRKRNNQGEGRNRIKIALQPEIPQWDIADVKNHPAEIGSCDHGDQLIPTPPATSTDGVIQALPAWTDHGSAGQGLTSACLYGEASLPSRARWQSSNRIAQDFTRSGISGVRFSSRSRSISEYGSSSSKRDISHLARCFLDCRSRIGCLSKKSPTYRVPLAVAKSWCSTRPTPSIQP